MSGGFWRVAVEAPDAATAEAAAAALADDAAALASFEVAPGGAWRVDALLPNRPERAALEARLALAFASCGVAGAPELTLAPLESRDWVAENQASFPPIRAGRFLIHGSHHLAAPPPGVVAIRIDAATAFGTGEHGSTHGCLAAFTALGKRRRWGNVLDMGTGTGILAIAAARGGARRVLACDIDRGSVAVARRNVAVNRARGRVRLAWSPGYAAAIVRRRGPYDLVFANILARPLARMAPALRRALAPGGHAILSGLLGRQESLVRAAHRIQGLTLVGRVDVAGWRTLVVKKGPACADPSSPAAVSRQPGRTARAQS